MKWTESDIKFLKEWYGRETASEIGDILCRSTYSIYRKAAQLGLKSTLQRHKKHAD